MEEVITPNMHMHAHLKECIEDYGPLHSFWLYAFERYNGILANIPNNNRSIECQLMNRFIEDIQVINSELPLDLPENLRSHFCRMENNSAKNCGSLPDTLNSTAIESSFLQWQYDDKKSALPSNRTRYVLNTMEMDNVKKLYAKLNCVSSSDTEIPSVCWKYSSFTLNGKVIGTYQTCSHSSSFVAATWDVSIFSDLLSSIVEDFFITDGELVRPVHISSFLLHRPKIESTVHGISFIPR